MMKVIIYSMICPVLAIDATLPTWPFLFLTFCFRHLRSLDFPHLTISEPEQIWNPIEACGMSYPLEDQT